MRKPGSLRVQLLRRLLGPMTAVLVGGAAIAYDLAIGPAVEAYDQDLVDVALALGERIGSDGTRYSFELPRAAEQLLRTDEYDAIYYRVSDPDGKGIAGDLDLPPPPLRAEQRRNVAVYDAEYRGRRIRAILLRSSCGAQLCSVQIAETTVKRERMLRRILASIVLPLVLLIGITLLVVWSGVESGLKPLFRLSGEIKDRSPDDLRHIKEVQAPKEIRPLIEELNLLFDKLHEANRNQRRFLSNAAHQLRTPLAGLRAHLELALSRRAGESLQDDLSQAHEATIRTARLANQLLALARAEPGGRVTDFSDVDVVVVIESAANDWVHRARDRGIDLGFEIQPATLRGDRLLFGEAIENLVANALDYLPRGGRVTVRCGTVAGRSFVEVEDDGGGIPAAERGRVRERFYRVPGTPGTGSGLGLAIVQEIVIAHEGTLAIESGTHGRGCRVRLEFPRPEDGKAAPSA
jgi:two-component system sensor histidine kinase TctE